MSLNLNTLNSRFSWASTFNIIIAGFYQSFNLKYLNFRAFSSSELYYFDRFSHLNIEAVHVNKGYHLFFHYFWNNTDSSANKQWEVRTVNSIGQWEVRTVKSIGQWEVRTVNSIGQWEVRTVKSIIIGNIMI